MNKEIQAIYFYDNHSHSSPATTLRYREALNHFFSFCAKPFDQIDASEIQTWLHSMEEQGLQPHVVHTKLSAVKSFYQYCIKENKLKKDPSFFIKICEIEEYKPKFLNQQEIKLLQEVTSTDTRARALIEVLYSTGIRVGELLNLKLDDVNWENRQFSIRGNQLQYIHFSHVCFTLLKIYQNGRMCDSEYLFCKNDGNKLDQRWLQFLFKKLSNDMGIKVSPHALRRSASTHFRE